MRRFYISAIFLLFLALNGLAAPTAYFSYNVFSIPGKGSYVETYLTVIGRTVSFPKGKDGMYQGAASISINVRSGEKQVDTRSYNLLSQPLADSTSRQNFIDVQRFVLDTGVYDFEIKIADANTQDPALSVNQKVNVNLVPGNTAFSGIELLGAFSKSTTDNILSKSGYDLIPYNSDYYPENMEQIQFYAELYNSNKLIPEGEKFVIETSIRNADNKRKLSSYGRFTKENPSTVNVVLSQFDIKDLPSGNYELVLEMRDKTGKIVGSQAKFFQRKNLNVQTSLADIEALSTENTFVSKYNSKDSLVEFIRCLYPISEKNELTFGENIIKSNNKEMMQKYILSFWQKRNALAPEVEWIKYWEQVLSVNKTFSSQIEKGYMTDRGRVYLQYGQPDNRSSFVHESSSYPYEIWQYNKIKKQSNRRFIFFDPDLMNNHKLLHSDAIGEPYEPRWQLRLRGKDHLDPNIDNTKAPDIYGNNPDENFRNPK